MFNKSLSQINFGDVESFCREWGEGIRVEYKRQLINDIPKTISAFANTLGGILVMGVSTDPNTNKVNFPIEGMDQAPGLEERLTQSGLTGIYPGVLPDVRILDVPDKPTKVIILVKIHESPEAPHAIQNSTRVYIRTGTISSPYELAEIDRIAYLLKRREQPEKLREELIAKTNTRLREHVTGRFIEGPYIAVDVARLFPREPILPPDGVYEFANVRRLTDPIVQHLIDRPKRIPNGVFSTHLNNSLPYAELSTYGLALTRSDLSLAPSSWKPNTGKLFVRPAEVISSIGRSLRFADKFFQWADFSANIKVTVRFENVLHSALQYTGHETDDKDYTCSDREFSVNEFTATENLQKGLEQLVTEISREVFWAFNCEYQGLESKVHEVLQVNHII